MKKLTLIVLFLTATATSACISSSEYTEDQAQADALERCSFYDDQKTRTHCMKEMMAAAEEERQAKVKKWEADQKAHEDKMARRGAMGLPTD